MSHATQLRRTDPFQSILLDILITIEWILISVFFFKNLYLVLSMFVWVIFCFVILYLFPSLSHTHTYTDMHTLTREHAHFSLLATRCQQKQVDGTLPHAEPSICCCLFPYLRRYTAYQYNKAERNKHSAAISGQEIWLKHCVRRELTAKTWDKDWLWSNRATDIFAGCCSFFVVWFFLFFFTGSGIEKVFISSPGC